MSEIFKTRGERLSENAGSLLDKAQNNAFASAAEIGSRSLKSIADGSWASLQTLSRGAHQTVDLSLNAANKYTRDIYDVGQHGRTDLTEDAGSFILGHSAMGIRNAARMSNIPISLAEKGIAHGLYNEKRLKKEAVKGTEILKDNPNAARHYYEIVAGKDKKESLVYSDRLAWNRYEDNGIHGLDVKGTAAIDKYSANRAHRMRDRKNWLLDNARERKKFHPIRSTRDTVSNQSRKLTTKAIQGGSPQDTTNATVLRFYNLANSRPVKKTAKNVVFHPVKTAKNVATLPLLPVKWAKSALGLLRSLIAGMFSALSTAPVILSLIAVAAPLLCAILAITMIITTVLSFNSYSVPIESMASMSYAANAFIYEAKKRNWQDNAIIGSLAYILQEGAAKGTFTYENYYCIPGPSGQLNDTTMDNSAWLSWINKSTTKNRYYEAYYKNNTSRYAAIGLGLLQDSDVWPNPSTPDIKEAANATRLINFAKDKGKSWQDPETQMTWIFEERFKPESLPFDTAGIDPTKDNLSAEEYCKRVVAGIGMPGMVWTAVPFNDPHVQQVGAAQNYLNNYSGFSYWSSPVMGDYTSTPNFGNAAAYREGNPYYTPVLTGQCTWFAWGRFFELYGFDPGFRGNGNQCAAQLVSTHPDKFELSYTPAAGSVFSGISINHVGIVTSVRDGMVTIDEGNVGNRADGTWETAIRVWTSRTLPSTQLSAELGGVMYAVPKTGV